MRDRGVSAILLAAGESRRMGPVNKLTLDIGGVPLLRRTALTLLGATLNEIVVVLGHESELATALLDGLDLRLVENPHYAEGQMTSVYRGMKALRAPCDGIMVCLCDQPSLEVADIETLIRAFRDDCPRSILVPTHEGRRGNPVVLASRIRDDVLAGDRDLGCTRLIQKYPEDVWPCPMDSDHCVFDLDTPEDYARLASRMESTGDAASEPIFREH